MNEKNKGFFPLCFKEEQTVRLSRISRRDLPNQWPRKKACSARAQGGWAAA
jgi:hypothetical protein